MNKNDIVNEEIEDKDTDKYKQEERLDLYKNLHISIWRFTELANLWQEHG